MENIVNRSLPLRLRNFVVILSGALIFVYVLLPLLTNSVGVLSSMASYLDENGIDPSRYYYTDVEQVFESVHYLNTALVN